MSADNGIYIAEFPKKMVKCVTCSHEQPSEEDRMYRVSHAASIDNVYYGDDATQDAYRAAIFGNATAFEGEGAEDKAWRKANQLAEEQDYLEYGVSLIKFDRPLVPHTQEKLMEVLGW